MSFVNKHKFIIKYHHDLCEQAQVIIKYLFYEDALVSWRNVFYLHICFLERDIKSSSCLCVGSMTILLIVKTHFGGSWVNGCAMRNLLLIHPISYLKEVVEVNTARLIEALRGCTYSKWWCLMLHGCFFMVKSFYKFLIDQRLSCSVIPSL